LLKVAGESGLFKNCPTSSLAEEFISIEKAIHLAGLWICSPEWHQCVRESLTLDTSCSHPVINHYVDQVSKHLSHVIMSNFQVQEARKFSSSRRSSFLNFDSVTEAIPSPKKIGIIDSMVIPS